MVKIKKGISLIVLVITIVIMIILASAVVITISKNNPISNAKELELRNKIVSVRNEWYEKVNKELVNGDISSINGPAENYLESAKSYPGELFIQKGELKISAGSTDQEINIAQELNIDTYPFIPDGFVASKATGENKVSNGLVIYEGTAPVTNANVKEAKTTRNQFVWVPVSNIKEFIREDLLEDGTSLDLTYCEEPYSGANDDEKNEYAAMMKSVEKYEGFYIARYEASKSKSDGKVQSIKGVYPWEKIPYGTDMTDVSGGAVEAARAKFPEEKASEGDPVSTLCYGVQWDQTVRFIEKNFPGISKDSIGRGNYYTKQNTQKKNVNTGTNDDYAQNNIYDMCGNVFEWTMEAIKKDGMYQRVPRGGACTNSNPISYRSSSLPDYTNWNVGFRIALYIK